MDFILLTQNETFIIGPVAKLLGLIMNAIFNLLDLIGLPNIGLAIILFTIVMYLLMMPLTIKQQKFSKLSAKMNPEIEKIKAKYKNKQQDQDAMIAQNQEIQAVYAKYGVSPTGSCVQLLIQMPVLFALYRVIYSMPAYVTKIGETFRVLADEIIKVDGGKFLLESGSETITNTVNMYGKAMTNGNLSNGIIDVLNKVSSTDMNLIAQHYGLQNLQYNGELILSSEGARGLIDTYNNFLGMNMGDSPMTLIKMALAVGAIGVVIGAVMIPVLAAVTQWINVKLMPRQTQSNNGQEDSMMKSMDTMNMIMPFMSAWFCLTLPAGMGLYWIAGSVVRSIQQVVINKHIDKMDFDELIKKNSAKSAKKLEKIKENQEKLNAYASMKTKSIESRAKSVDYREVKDDESTASGKSTHAKPGSIAAKAQMVKDFNEKNSR